MKLTISRRVRAAFLGTASLCLAAGGLAVLSSGAAQAVNAKAPPPLDHFLCYKAGPSFQLKVGISLQDPVHPVLYQPKPVSTYAHCNPANKVVPGARFISQNPLAHLLCFGITAPWKSRTVTMNNQFGKGVMVTGPSPSSLCLPSWKTNTANPNMTPSAPPKLDHFTCYPVKKTSSYGFKPPAPVKAQDEFNAPLYSNLKLKVATQLCVPTLKIDVTGQPFPPMTAADLSLLCFPSSPTPRWNLVFDENQFGQGPVKIYPPTAANANEQFCVPTTITSIV